MSATAAAADNFVRLRGRLVELGALRLTPAGLATISMRVRHESEQIEAGAPRRVGAELDAVAFEAQARLLAGQALNTDLRVEGFLCARSRRSNRLVLHATRVEFIEGEA